MIHPQIEYAGYKSNLRDKTKIYKVGDIPCHEEHQELEHYKTIYRFEESVTKYESIRDIAPDTIVYPDYLSIDIDSDGHFNKAISEAMSLTNFLDEYDIGYELWFSGGKGFHVLIPSVQFGLEPMACTVIVNVVKTMAVALAEGAKSTIDTSIYNVTRVFRQPFSYNIKGKKWKVPAKWVGKTWEEHDGYQDCEDYTLNDKLVELYGAILAKEQAPKPKVDHSKSKSSMWPPVAKGGRDNAAYKLARQLKERMISADDALTHLRQWNKDFVVPPLSDTKIKQKVISAYSKSSVSVIEDDNINNYMFDSKKIMHKMAQDFKDIDKKIIKTGYKFFDDYTLGLLPGDFVTWLACNGGFKSCILSGLLQRTSVTAKKPCLMVSMDMGSSKLGLRHIQAAESMDYKQVIKKLQSGGRFSKFMSDFKDLHIMDKKSLTVEQLYGFIEKFKTYHGDLGMVGIDYLGDFQGCDNDTQRTTQTIHELSDMAGQVDVPVVCLVQGRREFEGPVEMEKTGGKDASAIEHKSDYLIGSWYHYPAPTSEKEFWGRFLKARKFDGERFNDQAYFKINLSGRHMKLNDFVYESQAPSFNQKKSYGR